ncbi:MAG: hypothetical protein V1716_02870 [Candidatus Uhrbacteria bacterium]
MNKKSFYEVFLVFSLLSLGILVMILIIFRLNLQKSGSTVTGGVGAIGSRVAQENTWENNKMYFEAGYGFAYEVEAGQVTAVMAFSSANYPFAFACGTSIKVGSSVNYPLVQGDILFQEFPREGVYPTWNRVTGEYKEIVDLAEMNLDVQKANPLPVSEVTGKTIAMQKEACLTSSLGASIVFIISLIGLAVSFFLFKKNKSLVK